MLIKAVPLKNINPLICTIRELVGSQIPVFFYLRKYLTNNKFS